MRRLSSHATPRSNPGAQAPSPLPASPLKDLIDRIVDPNGAVLVKRAPNGRWEFTILDRKNDAMPPSLNEKVRNRQDTLLALRELGILTDQNPNERIWMQASPGEEITKRSLEQLHESLSVPQPSLVRDVAGAQQDARQLMALLDKFAPMELVLDLLCQAFGVQSYPYSQFSEAQRELNTAYMKLRPQDDRAAAAFDEFIRKELFGKLNASPEQISECRAEPVEWAQEVVRTRNAIATKCAAQVVCAMKQSSPPTIEDTLNILECTWNHAGAIPKHVERTLAEARMAFIAQYPNDRNAFDEAFCAKLLCELPDSLQQQVHELQQDLATHDQAKAAILKLIQNFAMAQRDHLYKSRNEILIQWPAADKGARQVQLVQLLRLTAGLEKVPNNVYETYVAGRNRFKQDLPNQSFGAALRPLLVELLSPEVEASYKELTESMASMTVELQTKQLDSWSSKLLKSSDIQSPEEAQREFLVESRNEILGLWQPVNVTRALRILQLLYVCTGGGKIPDAAYEAYNRQKKLFQTKHSSQSFGVNLRPFVVDLLPKEAQEAYRALLKEIATLPAHQQSVAIKNWAGKLLREASLSLTASTAQEFLVASEDEIVALWARSNPPSSNVVALRLLQLTAGTNEVPSDVARRYAEMKDAFHAAYPTEDFDVSLRPLLMKRVWTKQRVIFLRNWPNENWNEINNAQIVGWAQMMLNDPT